jgi:hypothetical protein
VPPPGLDRANTPGDDLHQVVARGWAALRRRLAAHDRHLPGFVYREVDAFLRCGDPAHGFAWLRCPKGHHHRLVPFSCKGRGFCPSCGGRRMATLALRWIDDLLPRVAVRQLVLTVPWPRRWLLARQPALARAMLRCALRVITRWLRSRGSAAARAGAPGSVTVVQRFGSALNLNLHFHVLLLDGLFVAGPSAGPRFERARRWTQDDVDRLVEAIAARCEALLARRGHGTDDDLDADDFREEDDALPLIQSAAIAGRSAVRSRPPARRVQVLGGRPYRLPPLCATAGGYSLHAAVVIRARDREGLRRLAGYIARPPLAKSRLDVLPDGRVRLGLKRAWSDGTTAHVLTPEEFVERLVALVPPPRANQVLYGGVLASRHRWHRTVRPRPPRRHRPPPGVGLRLTKKPRGQSRHVPWSTLLWRTFDVIGAACPTCGQVMELHAVVRGPETRRVLAGLERAARGPPRRAGQDAGA